MRILVVEDDTAVANLHREYFAKHGYNVTVCVDGMDGLEVFSADPFYFDLVITDLQMPRMSGLAMCEAMIALRLNIPIIIVSACSIDDADHALRRLGICKQIPKPVSMPELLKEVRFYLAWRPLLTENSNSANFVD